MRQNFANLFRAGFRAGARCGAVAIVLAMAVVIPAAAADKKIIASIAPLHSLVQNILGDTDTAHLLVPPGESPHHARLSPSQARLLQNADAVFYIDESFERFLARPLRAIPQSAKARIGGKPEIRHENESESHSDDDHGHDESDTHDHDDRNESESHSDEHNHGDEHENGESESHSEHESHAHDNSHDHGHDESESRDDEHDHGDDDHGESESHSDAHHDHGNVDWHIWLDISRARQVANRIAQKLAAIRPQHAAQYQKNLRRLDSKLADLDSHLQKMLTPVRARPFMTMHDAYQFFARRYKLSAIGALRGGHAESLSAKRLQTARQKLLQDGVICVFGEPQMPARQLAALAENTTIKTATIDPLGANLTPGATLYFDLMQQLARTFHQCLSPAQ